MQDLEALFYVLWDYESTFSKAMPQKLVADKFSKLQSTELRNVFLQTLEFQHQV